MSGDIGVMVCGHGSRDPAAVAEFSALADVLSARFPEWPVEHGFLEFARPVIRDGLDRLVARGVRHILAVPGMLFAAGHAKNDIPSVLNTYQAGHSGVRIEYGRELGLDPKMIRAAGARIAEALEAAGGDVSVHETLLLVVGRGARGDVAWGGRPGPPRLRAASSRAVHGVLLRSCETVRDGAGRSRPPQAGLRLAAACLPRSVTTS
jgi:sirohydrochlorin ferrochelatase